MKAHAPILQKYPIALAWPFAAMLSALLGSCAAPIPPPARPAPIKPAPLPPPKPPAVLPPSTADAHDWRDAPLTLGDWRWSMEGASSVARYGKAPDQQLILTCNRAAATLQLSRKITAITTPAAHITIRTATQLRNIPAQNNVELNALSISLPANDSIWDAIALSRGRFAVTAAGQSPIYAPSWPEVARVIEDCR
jgi:hypothetical protein